MAKAKSSPISIIAKTETGCHWDWAVLVSNS